MRKFASAMLSLVAMSAAPLYAQETAPGVCAAPESIVVTGNSRVDSAAVRSTAGLSTGTQLNVHDIQTAIKALYATGQFDDVQIVCRVSPPDNKATLVIQVKERQILTDYKVIGADRVSPKDVKESGSRSPESASTATKAFRMGTSFRRWTRSPRDFSSRGMASWTMTYTRR